MAKSREKIQQIGFWDPEVTETDHDSVCLWAYENAELILRATCPEQFDRPWKQSDIDHGSLSQKQYEEIFLAATAFMENNQRPNPRVVKRTLEHVLRTYTGFRNTMERIVGYADLLIDMQLPRIRAIYKCSEDRYADDIFESFEIGWRHGGASSQIVVEAKSVLPTVGELMRQIQLYRTAFQGKFVVVSPDASYSRVLAEQGVLFIQYPSA